MHAMFRRNRDPQKQKRNMIVLLILFFLAAGVLKVLEFRWPKATVMLADQPLNVLVAKTPKHRFKGLGGREDLGKYDGMLFLFFDAAQHSIVMRDMAFPIDIVWLENGVVVDFAPHVPIEPDSSEFELTQYYPRKPANVVLELPAGWTLEHGLKIGDMLSVVEE